MVIIKCERCGEEFESKSGRHRFCGQKCISKNYYNKNREEIIRKMMEWERRNPERRKITALKANRKYRAGHRERFNKSMIDNYRRNKNKWRSRSATSNLLNHKDFGKHVEIDRNCKFCGTKKQLEIHHEEYPFKQKDILKAIKERKIFYLCMSCHKKLHRKHLYSN